MINGQNQSGINVFPIRPLQITKWSYEEDCKNKERECSFCGISRKEFIIGSLIEVFLKNTKYPVALIEKINCACIENNIPEDIKKKAEGDQEKFFRWDLANTNEQNPNLTEQISVLYVKFDGKNYSVYHSYVLTTFYSGWDPSNNCYQRRKNNDNYDECMQSDLKNAEDVFNTKKEKVYECNLTQFSLMEIAYPILTEDNSCIAVMIIGQIPKETYYSSKALIKQLRSNVKKFEEVVKEQIKLRNKAFLSEFLESLISLPIEESQLLEELKNVNNNTNESEIIGLHYPSKKDLTIDQHIYSPDLKMLASLKQVSSICDDVIFYYNPEVNAKYCHIFEASNGTDLYFRIIETETIEEKQKAIQELMLRIPIPECDDSDSIDDQEGYVHLFNNNDSRNYFVGIIFYWKDYHHFSQDLKESIKGFVNSLGKAFHDALMTHISSSKQKLLGDLVDTLSHDLNQKIEIVQNHAYVSEKKIQTFSAGTLADSIFSDFAKDVRNMTNQLRFFVDETRARVANEPLPCKKTPFPPYGTFLFNLNEYYNSRRSRNLRAFYSPSVNEVSSVNPERYPEMKADPVLMERCTNNLLTNAEKYSFQYTNIFLDCYYDRKEDPKYYILRVTNYGKKIPEDFVSQIFDYGITGRNKKGKGIGLAVVKEICQMHNGFVELKDNTDISEYNIPLLFRTIQETNGDIQQFKNSFPDACIDYYELMVEYRRLMNESSDDNNYVAKQKIMFNQLNEVCARDIEYSTVLTKRHLEKSIKKPTARITFIVKIPIE